MTDMFNKKDVQILRELVKKKAELANLPKMKERKRLWYKQKALMAERPMILLESGSVNKDEMPIFYDMKCECEKAREFEWQLRHEIYHCCAIDDDNIVSPYISLGWPVVSSDYGMEVKIERGIDANLHSVGYRWEPPIKDLEKEFHKLKKRTHNIDKKSIIAKQAYYNETFGDILPTKIDGSLWWTFGLTGQAINLIGLDMLMIYMYEQPEALKQLLNFLMEDHIEFAKWAQNNGVLSLNNGHHYIGSGSYGFGDELPQKDYDPISNVRTDDLWLLLESQETVGISPTMYGEFIFPYHKELAKYFGLIYYGCCEPVHDRWDYISQIPNLRAVSISPWCNEEFMSLALGKNYIYSRKPAPAMISTHYVNVDQVNNDLKNTAMLIKKHSCNAEIIMKDLHTVNSEPERMSEWVKAARKAIDY